MKVLRCCAAIALWGSFAFSQSVDLSLTGCPSSVTKGAEVSVTVNYTADAEAAALRGVLILDVVDDAPPGDVLMSVNDHNSFKGYHDASGSHTFDFTLPSSLPERIRVRAYMTAYGLNPDVQARIATIPTDGTFPYQWSGNGVTQDLYYLGSLIISCNNYPYTYCSGITYETFLLTNENCRTDHGLPPAIGTMTVNDMRTLRRIWYGATGVPAEDESQCALAIDRYQIGVMLDDLEDARGGDFVQLWRHSGSGHSVVFQGWGHDSGQQINRLYYWSTQSSTNGVGFYSEPVGETSGIDINRVHIARVMKPRADDDWDRRLGQVLSAPIPTGTVPAELTLLEQE
jgi:hypothetical protein